MLSAPIPKNEQARLKALRDLFVLDTPPEEKFDRIVEFAAEQLEMPIALVTLVDGDRQWFKARVGLEIAQTPRDISFCGHTIMHDDIFEVPDASADERFLDNPLVIEAPFIRFYAGIALNSPTGEAIGSLCVIAPEVRHLDKVERAVLLSLRSLVNQALSGEDFV